MTFLGIDPGLSGGFAFIVESPEGISLQLHRMPLIGEKEYDIQEMKRLLKIHPMLGGGMFVTIEKQIALPGQGLSSTLKTGMGFGILMGLLAGLEVPHQIIPAPKWQRSLFVGMPAKQDTKVSSEVIAKRLFPTADFRKSERAKNVSDGLTDATCIAEYGRRTYGGHEFRRENLVPHQPMPGNEVVCGRCGNVIPNSDPHCMPR